MLIGYMNGRVGNSEVADVVGKWGVDGVNENGSFFIVSELVKNVCHGKDLSGMTRWVGESNESLYG